MNKTRSTLKYGPENILKGRIAETIVSEMLREAGYFVYQFGYEGLLQSLTQKGLPRMKAGDIEAEKVRTMPDFLIMDKEGDISFIEVKYRNNGADDPNLRRWAANASRHWPEAKILLVSPTAPHFQVSSIPAFSKTGKLYTLEADKFLKVGGALTKRYRTYIEKYL